MRSVPRNCIPQAVDRVKKRDMVFVAVMADIGFVLYNLVFEELGKRHRKLERCVGQEQHSARWLRRDDRQKRCQSWKSPPQRAALVATNAARRRRCSEFLGRREVGMERSEVQSPPPQ